MNRYVVVSALSVAALCGCSKRGFDPAGTWVGMDYPSSQPSTYHLQLNKDGTYRCPDFVRNKKGVWEIKQDSVIISGPDGGKPVILWMDQAKDGRQTLSSPFTDGVSFHRG